MRIKRLVPFALLASTLVPAARASAATFTYPGAAPCDTTLQACIDGVAPGSTIQIDQDIVDETLTINKSLTLRPSGTRHPVIGGTSTHRAINVDGTAGLVAVRLQRLRLQNANVDVDFTGGSGHSFELMKSRILVQGIPGVDLSLRVPSTALVQNSFIQSTDDAITTTFANPSGGASALLQGNQVTASSSSGSGDGISVGFDNGGTARADLYSNVIYGVTGCNCGGASGIKIQSGGAGSGTADIGNNTLDDLVVASEGIAIEAPEGGGTLTANVFNNVVTHATNAPIKLPDPAVPSLKIHNGFNDFFQNSEPPDFGGYSAGPSTLNLNPRYVDRDGDNYRLKATSRLRNRGTNTPTGEIPLRDADRNARVNEARVDVGAYEFRSHTGCTQIGTRGTDTLIGTSGSDILCGGPGADRLKGKAGNDLLLGGPGGDSITGGTGGDMLRGEDGPDFLDSRDGTSGNDQLFGGGGTDTCRRDPGDHTDGCP